MQFFPVRAANGDLLANIKAASESEAYAVYFAMEEQRILKKKLPDVCDGRDLVRPATALH